MLGKEVKELYANPIIKQKIEQVKFKPTKITLEKQEKYILVECKSNGNVIKMKFNSQKRKEYAAAAIDYWFNYITAYEIVPEGIYLPPETYWFIYKKNHIGAAYLKGTGYELTVNGKRHTFVPTSYYFKDREPAVYGLYYNDELIYIGSSRNYTHRWGEHYISFFEGSMRYNVMYKDLHDERDKIEYKVLYDSEAVIKLAENDEPSMHQYETVEKLCIEHYKPKYNTQGVTMEFYYQAEMKREDYKLDQNIIKNLHFED